MARKSTSEAPIFGKNLAAIRKARGFTQEELATKVGSTCSLINYYERLTKNPTADVLLKLSDILGVSVDELLGKESLKVKPGPVPKIERQLNEIQKLSKEEQKAISTVLDMALQQAKHA